MSDECDYCKENILECHCGLAEAADFLMPFGKYEGKPLKDLPYEYKKWIIETNAIAGHINCRSLRAHIKRLLDAESKLRESMLAPSISITAGYGIETIHKESVNHPTHYKGQKYEVIDIIEDFGLGFNLGNSIKYILRAGKKGLYTEDLKKAIWYLEREIDHPS